MDTMKQPGQVTAGILAVFCLASGVEQSFLSAPHPREFGHFLPVSRSETTTVSVGLSPRTAANHLIQRRGATAERSNRTVAFNRRSATHDDNVPHPWTEVHGYHHGLAPRGAGLRKTFFYAQNPALRANE